VLRRILGGGWPEPPAVIAAIKQQLDG